MVTTDCGREAMQRRERFQENVPRELGRGILAPSLKPVPVFVRRQQKRLTVKIGDIADPSTLAVMPDSLTSLRFQVRSAR